MSRPPGPAPPIAANSAGPDAAPLDSHQVLRGIAEQLDGLQQLAIEARQVFADTGDPKALQTLGDCIRMTHQGRRIRLMTQLLAIGLN